MADQEKFFRPFLKSDWEIVEGNHMDLTNAGRYFRNTITKLFGYVFAL